MFFRIDIKIAEIFCIILLGFIFHLMRCEAAKLIDLTHQLTPEIPFYPSHERFNFTKIITRNDPFWAAINSFCSSEHSGTHLDAPYHFYSKGWKTHEIPVDRLVAPAVVIDISERIDQPEEFALSFNDLIEWERRHGMIPKHSIVFMFSGWDKYWGDKKKYIFNNQEIEKSVRTPGFSSAAAAWLVHNRQIVGIGVDTATVEVGLSTDALVHRTVAASNVYCLENVANLGSLPPVGATVYAFPINIKDGTGAPARIIASVTDDEKLSSYSNDMFDSIVNFLDWLF